MFLEIMDKLVNCKYMNHILCLDRITKAELNVCFIVGYKRIELRFDRLCI